MSVLSASIVTSIYSHFHGIIFPITGTRLHYEFHLLALSIIAILFNPVFWRRHILRNEYLFYQSASIALRFLSGLVLDSAKGLDLKIALSIHVITFCSIVKLAHLSFTCLFLPELSEKRRVKETGLIEDESESIDDILAHLGSTHFEVWADEERNYHGYKRLRDVFRGVGLLGMGAAVYASYLLALGFVDWVYWLAAAIGLNVVRLIWLSMSCSGNERRRERLWIVCYVYSVVIVGQMFWRVFGELQFEIWEVIEKDAELFEGARLALVVGTAFASGLSVF
jgi:hypothetical protein